MSGPLALALILWVALLAVLGAGAAVRRWRRGGLPLRALVRLAWPAGLVVVALVASVRLQATDLFLRTGLDISQNRHNQLSDATLTLLRNVDRAGQPVRITGFFPADRTEWRPVTRALERYADRSRHLDVRFVDPDQEASTARGYGVEKVGDVIVESGGNRARVGSPSEVAVSSAIAQVVNGDPVVCWVAGHGEIEPDDSTLQGLTAGFAQAGIVLQRVRLAALEDLPPECTLVAVVAPRTPPLEHEAALLRRRVEARDLKLMLLVDPDVASPEVNRAWSGLVDVSVGPGLVSDPDGAIYGDPRTLLVDRFPSLSPVTQSLPAVLFVGAAAIGLPDGGPEDLTTTVLATATPQAGHDGRAPALAVALDRSGVEGKGEGAAIARFRAIVVGDADWLRNSSWAVSANSTMAAQSLRWLAEPESLISVPVPVPGGGLVAVSSEDIRRIDTGMFAVPALLVGLAWAARRLRAARRAAPSRSRGIDRHPPAERALGVRKAESVARPRPSKSPSRRGV